MSRPHLCLLPLLAGAVLGAVIMGVAARPAAAVIVRVSIGDQGQQAQGFTWGSLLSGNGRYVFWATRAPNLVPGDTNGTWDIFVRDLVTGAVRRADVDAAGRQITDDNCALGGVTPDGRYVAIGSKVSLVTGVNTGTYHWYIKDLVLGTAELLVDVPYGGWALPLSADGRYALFTTDQDGLVAADHNGLWDSFVRDRTSQETECVSLGRDGLAGNGAVPYGNAENAISAEGRYVVFTSTASNLILNGTTDANVYLRDRQAGTTELVSFTPGGLPSTGASRARMSPDGRFIAFSSADAGFAAGDTNGVRDVFLRDRTAGTTERISVGEQGEEPNDHSDAVALSADGRYVAFVTSATNLAPGCVPLVPWRYLFLRDRQLQTTTLLSVGYAGGPKGVSDQYEVPNLSMSDDGRLVAFDARVSDLVPSDTNGCEDIFLWDPAARFYDLPSRYWAFPAVEACVAVHVVGGYPDGTYHPMEVVNRGQMAAFVSRALAGGDSNIPDGPPVAHFPDVATTDWAYKYVAYVYDNTIVGGYPDGTYGPELAVDRGQMAAFLARAMVTPHGEAGLTSYTPPSTPSFPDVPTDFWTFKHIEYLREHAVVGGYPDGYYHPEMPVSRDQMAVFVARAFELPM